SRSRVKPGNDRCALTNRSQSRTRGSHHRLHGVDEGLPGLTLLGQLPASLRREPVEASTPLARLLDPAALDPAAVLETEERGVERRQGERQPAARAGLDELADFVPMAGPGLEQRQDEHLGAAFLQFCAEHCAKAPYM